MELNQNTKKSVLFEKDDDMETIYQKCKLWIKNESIIENQTKIYDFFKTNQQWTRRDEVKYFGNDKRKKNEHEDDIIRDDKKNKYYKKV